MNYEEVTELPGASVSRRQLARMYTRYHWTAERCRSLDVLEVGCGAGQGLGMIAKESNSTTAGDVSHSFISIAERHYKNRVHLKQFDAISLPFEESTFDVVVIHEAIYYVCDLEVFISEVKRVLRNNGRLLITTANKDLFDFHPSKYHQTYLGVVGLHDLLEKFDFTVRFWGSEKMPSPYSPLSVIRWIKFVALMAGVIPKTMVGKKILRRMIFGRLEPMPSELVFGMCECDHLDELVIRQPCTTHATIFCEATLRDE